MKIRAIIGAFCFLNLGSTLVTSDLPTTSEGDWEALEAAARRELDPSRDDSVALIMAETGYQEQDKQRQRQRAAADLARAIEASQREQKEREEQEAQALAQALQQIKDYQEQEQRKKEQEQAQLEPEVAQAIQAIEEMEKKAYEEELKRSQPFFERYRNAVSPQHPMKFNIIRPEIIQQTDLECGYLSALNGILVYQGIMGKAQSWAQTLRDKERIKALLQSAQQHCNYERTLLDSDIANLVKLYRIPADAYGFYNEQLPNDIRDLGPTYLLGGTTPTNMVSVLQKLCTQKGFTHIFFLRKSGAHGSVGSLGHWISVVAHNNDNKSIDLYILDSQYPTGEKATYRRQRMNHDLMWQALVILLRQVDDQIRQRADVD